MKCHLHIKKYFLILNRSLPYAVVRREPCDVFAECRRASRIQLVCTSKFDNIQFSIYLLCDRSPLRMPVNFDVAGSIVAHITFLPDKKKTETQTKIISFILGKHWIMMMTNDRWMDGQLYCTRLKTKHNNCNFWLINLGFRQMMIILAPLDYAKIIVVL